MTTTSNPTPDPDEHDYEGDGTSDCAECGWSMNAHASAY